MKISVQRAVSFVIPCGLMVFVGTGCQSPPGGGVAKGTHEKSARPGINKPYEKPDVATWIKRFESEKREVFRYRHKIVESVGVGRGDAVADVGAGTGLFTELFAGQVGRNGVVCAVDIAQNFLDHIAARAKEQGRGNIKTVLCNQHSVELPARSLDIAFVCNTYHHFEYPKSSMRSIYDALKPGGRLIVIDFEKIPGTSRQWILDHVRAGKEQVVKEIESVGFDRIADAPEVTYLKENYFLRFRKPGRM